jgi:hypothetical protein
MIGAALPMIGPGFKTGSLITFLPEQVLDNPAKNASEDCGVAVTRARKSGRTGEARGREMP